MRVYRLVNEEHDSVTAGMRLTRISDYSHQKLGEGMYFALSREDALAFAATQHGHKYTHLLGCVLENMTHDNFVDLRSSPNLLVRSKFNHLPKRQQGPAYCNTHGKNGVIWNGAPGKRWVELCLYPEHIGNGVLIESVEPLIS
jgi:hypothetical protein